MRTKLFFICMACLLMAWNTNAQTVEVTITAGGLDNALSGQTGITSLKVNGTMDARDFKTILGFKNTLSIVDLGGVTEIKHYDNSGTPGTISNSSYDSHVNNYGDPYPAGELPANAFYQMTQLTTVILSSNFNIGRQSFSSCSKLTQVTIPEGVTAIKESAFYGCSALTTITLPSTLNSMGTNIFNGTGITQITLPKGINSIPDGTFSACKLLGSITMLGEITSIGSQAFKQCLVLPDLTIPASVTSIGSQAFYACRANFTFEPRTTPITISGNQTFYGCTGLTSFTFPENTVITDGTMYQTFYKSTNLSSINIPVGVTVVDGAFRETALTSITIPEGVTTLGSFTFYKVATLQSVALPSTLTSIGTSCFNGVSSVSNLELPAALTTIGNTAFNGMTSLTSLKVNGTFPVTLSSDPFSGVDKTACTLYVPAEALEAYQQADYWKNFTHIEGFVVKQNQTITGLSEISKTVNDADFDLTATATSGLAVTYSSSNTAVATISGSTVTIVGAGTTTITASQAGDDTYSAASPVTATLTVSKASQTISGLSNLDKTVGDADFDLSATASSSLTVTYASSNENVATISGSTVHIVGAGTTTITASQAGDDTYNAATDVTATLTVSKASQTITGLSDVNKKVGDADFTLSATATSGLVVIYASSNENVATISGNTVHIVGAGATTITASQAGNDSYSAATDITATLTVSKASQTISGLSNMDKTVGDADFTLSATASSSLTVTYASSNENVATISGSTVHIVGAGATTITASQAGNDTYSAATPVTATLTVTPITGIGELHATIPVRIQNNNLIVSVQAGSIINIYNVLGVCLQSKTAEKAETVISNLPKGQILIVRCGKAVAKVIL